MRGTDECRWTLVFRRGSSMAGLQALREISANNGVSGFFRCIPTCSVHPGGNGGGPSELITGRW